ncbi:malonate decarboxylase holo-ACP synthase [Solibacillus sp. MA9]|uniref:Malonate decarboxylase holo-ACP synthase n=1 Tax=Solibacillus palustris TaxID=2908203 RepID=A0ABS9U7M5_9BACL|nr:malonate decarboxylase holo-ACP synthase [Solibacillus sp. MA9]MCH7320324.1 malonate decarboxylase holo-ACP synthase [Solibacillus sp. MA9]
MELAVHDLVYLNSIEEIEFFGDLPDWMNEDEMAQGIAVVRRMKVMKGKVAIGFRGDNRSKRFAAITSISNIKREIRPFDILKKTYPASHKQSLQYIAEVLDGFKWGIGGSVGFSMATGINVCHENSDIDIIIYCEKLNELDQLMPIFSELQKSIHRVDVQIEILDVGAVMLADYLEHHSFILRTSTGPVLLKKDLLKFKE